MRPPPEVHDALACLLTYPGAAHSGMRYPAAIEVVSKACPETAESLHRFAEATCDLEPGELEELYTRTFDNVAERSLEVGWQLFGENYARGALMVRFRDLMRRYEVEEHTELARSPDARPAFDRPYAGSDGRGVRVEQRAPGRGRDARGLQRLREPVGPSPRSGPGCLGAACPRE